jgi:hypothetical protein
VTVTAAQMAEVLKQHQPEPTEATRRAWREAARPEIIEDVIAALVEHCHACTEPKRGGR